ncbi:uncharacterized protein LOC129598261 isoform X2 [Paramacrobiotus metropolitanus]|uniref:uncharacterized protein LOC129598261 isoform X2 n=1 Tax=Paramacrobiotus metropolitanus TaxID=2943436 RepID=UPI002445B787|nr:uncharacterized protein LOC129598261 isoform X2 [Paramacrobiotus metropolitanus]
MRLIFLLVGVCAYGVAGVHGECREVPDDKSVTGGQDAAGSQTKWADEKGNPCEPAESTEAPADAATDAATDSATEAANDTATETTTETATETATESATEAATEAVAVSAKKPTGIITHTITMTYTSDAQRDALLQKILAIWKIVITTQFKGSDVSIKFVSAKPGATANSKTVTYTISFAGPKLDTQLVLQKFKTQFSSSKIEGVTLTEDTPTTSTSKVAVGPPTMKTLRHTILIRYATPQQRENLMKLVMKLWSTVLTTYYQASEVNYNFISDAPTDMKGYKAVTYDVLFTTTLQTINIQDIQLKFQAQYQIKKVPGTMLLEGSPSLTGNVKIENQTIIHTIIMKYETEDQRDTILKMILDVWRLVLLKFGVKDVRVEYVDEKQQKISSAKIITYKIIYMGKKVKVSYKVLLDMFAAQFKIHSVTGVTLLTDIATALSTHTVTQSLLNTLGISYTTEEQRDEKLQQILQIWTVILAQYGYKNPRITVVSEEPVPTKILKYKIEYEGDAISNVTDEFNAEFGINLFPNIMLVEGSKEVNTTTQPPPTTTTKVSIATPRRKPTTTTTEAPPPDTEAPSPPPETEAPTTTPTEAPPPPDTEAPTTTEAPPPPDTEAPTTTEAPPPDTEAPTTTGAPPPPYPTPAPPKSTPKKTPAPPKPTVKPTPKPPAPTPKPPAPTPKPPGPTAKPTPAKTPAPPPKTPAPPPNPRPTVPRGRRRTVFDRK